MSDASSPCPSGGGPVMTTDISGVGVRVSFYLQTLFLACLSARSRSLDEIRGALYTLIATNMAMALTALILGLKLTPEISFQDALVVFYLLFLSWITVVFILPSCHRFTDRKGAKVLEYLSVAQSYLVFAFLLSVLIKAKQFGSSPQCNANAVVVIFRPFSALKAGRIVGWIAVITVMTMYTAMTVAEYLPPPPKRMRVWMQRRRTKKVEVRAQVPEPGFDFEVEEEVEAGHIRPRPEKESGFKVGEKSRVQPKTYDLGIAGDLIVEIAVVIVLWAMAVLNTELLINWNRFEPSDGSTWQFGQVLPMFLVILPLVNMVSAFSEYGVRRL